MRTLVFGYSQICHDILKYLLERGENVVALITHEDNPKENIWFDTPDKVALKYNIPIYKPKNVNTKKWINLMKNKIKPDIIFSFFYRKIICEEIINYPSKGAINLHCSYLPSYRGCASLNWALINGERYTGATLHYMVKEPDAGDIIAQKEIKITFKDDINSLYKKFLKESFRLFKNNFEKIKKSKVIRKRQDSKKASYFGRRKPEDGHIDWSKSTIQIYNMVRGLTKPYPGAFGIVNNIKFYIWKCTIIGFTEKTTIKRYLKSAKIKLKNGEGIFWKGKLYIKVKYGFIKVIDYSYNIDISKDKKINFK